MSTSQQQASDGGLRGQQPAAWSAGIERRLVELLTAEGVAVQDLDAVTARFEAVPLGGQFNKPRSNLLLRRETLACGSSAYVDADLAYQGDRPMLRWALSGPCHSNWRKLRGPPLPGTIDQVLDAVLRLLESPLTARLPESSCTEARQSVQQFSDDAPGGSCLPDAAVEEISPAMASAAYSSSFRKELARELAVLTRSPAAPHSAVLWGQPGCGRDHLMLASAAPLFEAGAIPGAYQVSGALVAAGCVLLQELDLALINLFRECTAQRGWLVLFRDLDLCVSGTAVSHGLLCDALDRGLRMLATVRSPRSLARLQHDGALARRLVAVHVPAADRRQTAAAVQGLVEQSTLDVVSPTITAAVRVSAGDGAAQPAAALAMVGRALAKARWDARSPVGPDDLFHQLENQWPEETSEE